MKKNEKKKPFGYGPLILLMGACLMVMTSIVAALIIPSESKEEIIIIESEHIDEDADSVSQQHGIEASEEHSEVQKIEENTQGSEVHPELEGQQQEIQQQESQEEVIPEPESLFTVSDKSYFDDALFIGDSRTAGLKQFGTLDNADYFASPGLNLYTINSTKVEVEKGKKMKLEALLSENVYGKVYIMLGINELGYDFDTTVEKYRAFLDYIFSYQPQAIIYVCANMHVNSLRNELDEIHNNAAINRMNEQILSFADQEKIFYLDVNPLFDDENGNLSQMYVSDDTHLMGMYYETWCEWYCQNTVLIEN